MKESLGHAALIKERIWDQLLIPELGVVAFK